MWVEGAWRNIWADVEPVYRLSIASRCGVRHWMGWLQCICSGDTTTSTSRPLWHHLLQSNGSMVGWGILTLEHLAGGWWWIPAQKEAVQNRTESLTVSAPLHGAPVFLSETLSSFLTLSHSLTRTHTQTHTRQEGSHSATADKLSFGSVMDSFNVHGFKERWAKAQLESWCGNLWELHRILLSEKEENHRILFFLSIFFVIGGKRTADNLQQQQLLWCCYLGSIGLYETVTHVNQGSGLPL